MVTLKSINRGTNKQRILRLLSVVSLVITLVLSPSLFSDELQTNGLPLEATAHAQTAPLNLLAQADTPAPVPAPESSESEDEQSIDFFAMLMGALAGLVLFIFGVTRLAEGLEDIGTERMRSLLGKFTTNRFAGVATGAVATTALESSSVTIIMVIAMVSAGVLTFVQSLGVVLGSNIGTAVGAQIISLNIELYIPILMFAGLLLLFLGRNNRQKTLGLVLLGFGLMFYGLESIDRAMEPFREYEPFLNWMETLGRNPILGALIGALFTIVIQSSSATVAIVVTLAGSGLIGLAAGIAIMLGAEVGTCADTLVATVGRGRAALRTGLFHFLFNLGSAILGILFAPQLAQVAQSISGGGDVGRQVANAQMIFNIIGVVAVIGFLPLIARGLERLVPDTQADLEREQRQAEKRQKTPEPVGASASSK
ncbi:Na/Pi cotransporter family protein [Phormidium tenue FACHB-886]|nr:Na/Pi cotransporter family protein [Phormidium tenue FACHB-886]